MRGNNLRLAVTNKSKIIDKKSALKIAMEEVSKLRTPDQRKFKVYSRKPAHLHIYGMPSEPCWFVYAPWNDGYDGAMLRSSRIILISKKTGRVVYDGPANDE